MLMNQEDGASRKPARRKPDFKYMQVQYFQDYKLVFYGQLRKYKPIIGSNLLWNYENKIPVQNDTLQAMAMNLEK